VNQKRASRNPVDSKVILKIAGRHFAQKGFAGARMDEIAQEAEVNKATLYYRIEEAEVNKATLYYRIGDKEALYESVLTTTMDQAIVEVKAATEQCDDVEQQLRRYITALAAHIDRHPCFTALMMRELAGGAENITDAALSRMHTIRTMLSDILTRGVTQQHFRQLNPFLIHMQIIGCLMFYSAGSPVRQKMVELKGNTDCINAPIEDAAAELADIILHSVRNNT
jgi:AcrR family transcriptional regulator